MNGLRELGRGIMVLAVAGGFSFVPTAPAEAAPAPTAVVDFCPFEPGWYYLYDENDELIGVMLVDEDCNARIW